MEKGSLFNKWCWENWTATYKRIKVYCFLRICILINSKWIRHLNVRHETINLDKNVSLTSVIAILFFVNQICRCLKHIRAANCVSYRTEWRKNLYNYSLREILHFALKTVAKASLLALKCLQEKTKTTLIQALTKK